MYLSYINYFRGFAILMVVLGHFLYFPKDDITSKLVVSILQGATGPFVFISGFLFEHIFYKRGFDYRNFMKGKIKNVLLPYTIVIIPILVYYFYKLERLESIQYSNKLIYIILLYYSGKGLKSTWYIPFAMLLFIASPIILKFIKLNAKKQKEILIISIFISMFIKRPVQDLTLNIFQAFIYFFPFYIMGIYISQRKEKIVILLEKNKLFLGISWVLIIIVQLKLNLYTSFPRKFFDSINYYEVDLMVIQKILLCLFFIGMFKKLENQSGIIIRILKKILEILAYYSFGIFFLHNYFNIIIFKILLFLGINPEELKISSCILLGILSILFSICIVKIIKFIFKTKSRMIVGC